MGTDRGLFEDFGVQRHGHTVVFQVCPMSRDVLKSMSPPGAQHTPPLLTQEHAEWDLEYQRCRVPFCMAKPSVKGQVMSSSGSTAAAAASALGARS